MYMKSTSGRPYWTVKEFAKESGFSEKKIIGDIKAGLIVVPERPKGSRPYKIPIPELEKYLKQRGIMDYANSKSEEELSPKFKNDLGIEENHRRQEHYNSLIEVAITILGASSGLRKMDDGKYEIDRYEDDDGWVFPVISNREDIIYGLNANIEEAYDKHRLFNMFEMFLSHFIPENPTKSELHKRANEKPEELIKSLKEIILHQKKLDNHCEICQNW
jgi:hypothetical protein